MEAGAQKREKQHKKVVRRLLGQNLRLVQRIQLAAAAKQAGGVGERRRRRRRRRRDEAAATNEDYERSDNEIQVRRKNGRSRWWVSELLAADCEKAWIHPR